MPKPRNKPLQTEAEWRNAPTLATPTTATAPAMEPDLSTGLGQTAHLRPPLSRHDRHDNAAQSAVPCGMARHLGESAPLVPEISAYPVPTPRSVIGRPWPSSAACLQRRLAGPAACCQRPDHRAHTFLDKAAPYRPSAGCTRAPDGAGMPASVTATDMSREEPHMRGKSGASDAYRAWRGRGVEASRGRGGHAHGRPPRHGQRQQSRGDRMDERVGGWVMVC